MIYKDNARYCRNCSKRFVKNARAISCFMKYSKWLCGDCQKELKE